MRQDRDARPGLLDDEGESRRRAPAKKDRRRWCGGRVGREHQLVIDVPPNAVQRDRPCGWQSRSNWWVPGEPWYFCKHAEICSVCGRIFREHFSFLTDSALKAEECPDYQPRP